MKHFISIWFVVSVMALPVITGSTGSSTTVAGQGEKSKIVTVPMVLDHNRTMIDAEAATNDGKWIPVRLWIDSGDHYQRVSSTLLNKLGFSPSNESGGKNALRLRLTEGNKSVVLDTSRVTGYSNGKSDWIFNATGADANLPATVLINYDVVIDYAARTVTFGEAGTIESKGLQVSAEFSASSGIAQLNVEIGGKKMSLSLDVGASYTFISGETLSTLTSQNPGWPSMVGAAGCANMWGTWPPREDSWNIHRVPAVKIGGITLEQIGAVASPQISGESLGSWYSSKTAQPVEGFLGGNALRSLRIQLDYLHRKVFLEIVGPFDSNDLDVVGLGLHPESDRTFKVISVSKKNGKPTVEGVKLYDILVSVDGKPLAGLTMGAAVNMLRGKPGDQHVLVLNRDGKQIAVTATVQHLL